MARFMSRVAIWLLVALGMASPARADLEGRWRLVEQRYNSGQANLVRNSVPLWLEFLRDGPRLSCRVRIGEHPTRVLDWPGLPSEHGPRPFLIEQRVIDAAGGQVRARYRTGPAIDDGETLLVVEDYRVSEDGRTLTGTVDVTLLQDGESRGGYVLHRRFEKEP